VPSDHYKFAGMRELRRITGLRLCLENRRQLLRLFTRSAQRDRYNYWVGHLESE